MNVVGSGSADVEPMQSKSETAWLRVPLVEVCRVDKAPAEQMND